MSTWGYDARTPGPVLRSSIGGTLSVVQRGRLPEATTTHFHGVALRNNADGAPELTQRAIAAGGSFTATVKTAHPDTLWTRLPVARLR